MLYYLFEFLEQQYELTGASVFRFLSFRAALAVILSLGFSLITGKRIIAYLKRKQIGETVRDLGLSGQKEKEGRINIVINLKHSPSPKHYLKVPLNESLFP